MAACLGLIDRRRMDQQFLILTIAVVVASALQSATGIGFGVIAGPVMLIVLNSGAAIQISIALSLLIAVVLVPSLWRNMDRQLLVRFLAGSLVGIPVGLVIFLSIEIDLLKLLAGLAVLFTLVFVLRAKAPTPLAGGGGGGKLEQLSMGAISGAMSGSLAMPGPIPAAWMLARGYDKATVRATILAMFIFSYPAALALQAFLVGVSSETVWQSMILAPPALVGVYIGRWLAALLTERIFQWALISVLAATTIFLFFSSIPNLVTR